MIERIKQIMEAQHLNQNAFASTLGISPASLSSMFKGRTQPSLNLVQRILNRYSDINPMWLLDGVGGMMKGTDDSASSNSTKQQTTNQGASQTTQQQSEQTSATLSHHPTWSSPDSIYHDVVQNTAPQSQRQQPGFQIMTDKAQPIKERKITEIRIFYDDMTWDAFVPKEKK